MAYAACPADDVALRIPAGAAPGLPGKRLICPTCRRVAHTAATCDSRLPALQSCRVPHSYSLSAIVRCHRLRNKRPSSCQQLVAGGCPVQPPRLFAHASGSGLAQCKTVCDGRPWALALTPAAHPESCSVLLSAPLSLVQQPGMASFGNRSAAGPAAAFPRSFRRVRQRAVSICKAGKAG